MKKLRWRKFREIMDCVDGIFEIMIDYSPETERVHKVHLKDANGNWTHYKTYKEAKAAAQKLYNQQNK